MPVTTPRLVIGGLSSGAGKTSLVVALARALRARGLSVSVFKCGPDYLDPTYHQRAAGRRAHNLDGWMMGRDAVVETFARASAGTDIALVEGVMGLYDGASPTAEVGSTAELAKWLGAPVLLAVDARGMARTIAAVARGFASFDPDLNLAGLLCNRVGSEGHLELLRKACSRPPVLGGLPRRPELAFPERHLGLRTADDDAIGDGVLDAWGELAASWIDLDRLLDIAASAPTLLAPEAADGHGAAPRCRIGVAMDPAFHFYYEDNLARLRALGAELVPFSPMADSALPADLGGIYLGGGYPEVHARQLEANGAMRAAIRRFAGDGGVVYAECGGLVYLCRAVRAVDGTRREMVGLFDAEARMLERLAALGYVEVELQEQSILGAAGMRFRGHQFRYSELVETGPLERIYTIRRRRGAAASAEGYRQGSVVASYVHGHWASNPLIARHFVDSCARRGPA